MWGAVIGAAAGLAGSLIGGSKARREAKRQRAIYKNQLTQARADLLRYANQDFSQSDAGQAATAAARQLQEEQLQNARGADAVMGTHTVDQAIAANGQAQAQLASNLAVNGQNQQMQARQYYGQLANSAASQLAGAYGQQAQANTAAGSQAMQAGMGLAAADLESHKETGHGILHNMFGLGKRDRQ